MHELPRTQNKVLPVLIILRGFVTFPGRRLETFRELAFQADRPEYAKAGLQSSWLSIGSTWMVSGFVSLALDGEVRHIARLRLVHNTYSVKASYLTE